MYWACDDDDITLVAGSNTNYNRGMSNLDIQSVITNADFAHQFKRGQI
jgi:hypothetical protein